MTKTERRNNRISFRKDLNTNKNWCSMQRGGANKRRWRRINRLNASDDWKAINSDVSKSEMIELVEC